MLEARYRLQTHTNDHPAVNGDAVETVSGDIHVGGIVQDAHTHTQAHRRLRN